MNQRSDALADHQAISLIVIARSKSPIAVRGASLRHVLLWAIVSLGKHHIGIVSAKYDQLRIPKIWPPRPPTFFPFIVVRKTIGYMAQKEAIGGYPSIAS
jgi:hypothetical protein